MTREEQIEQAAGEFAGVNYDCETEADAFYHAVQKEAFVAGAAYADEHPDLYSVTRKAIEREREHLIDKVCKWLEEHLLLDDPKWYVEGEKTLQEKMIDDLRKAMEEQQ